MGFLSVFFVPLPFYFAQTPFSPFYFIFLLPSRAHAVRSDSPPRQNTHIFLHMGASHWLPAMAIRRETGNTRAVSVREKEGFRGKEILRIPYEVEEEEKRGQRTARKQTSASNTEYISTSIPVCSRKEQCIAVVITEEGNGRGETTRIRRTRRGEKKKLVKRAQAGNREPAAHRDERTELILRTEQRSRAGGPTLFLLRLTPGYSRVFFLSFLFLLDDHITKMV